MFRPSAATLIVSGDVTPARAAGAARKYLASWTGSGERARRASMIAPKARPASLLLINRPGAPQSELCVGHLGPARATPDFHRLVTLNAVLGGQFSSRINQNLRESKGVTYGATTAFEFRRTLGAFVCQTSVHTEATATAVTEILAEFEAVRSTRPVDADELVRAKNSLTRGYVRNFETSEQTVRAATQLVAYGLPDDTFDQFVPRVADVDAGAVLAAARAHVRPDDAVIVVVGDAEHCRESLTSLGRPLNDVEPEF
jgi:predicted Zn-dependent peptidase